MQRDKAIVFHQQGTTPGCHVFGLTIELTRLEIIRVDPESLSRKLK